MKTNAILAALLVLVFGVAALAIPDSLSDREAANRTRACIPVSGHSTQLSVSASAANASAFDQWTVYSMICTVSVYYEAGDGSAATADSNSNYLPADTMIYFSTGGSAISDFMSAVDTAATGGTCYINKCR